MKTPSNYVCKDCGASHCKLWRVAGSSNIRLYCVSCAESVSGDRLKLGRNSTDQLYNGGLNLVPAVPTEDGEEWYGYTSVPQDRCDWWAALPMTTPIVVCPECDALRRQLKDTEEILWQANALLFGVLDLIQDPEHQIVSHAASLPDVFRRVAGAAEETLQVLQGILVKEK